MKALITVLFTCLLSGCLGYKPDQRVVGLYTAPTGEAVDIMEDGRIVYIARDTEEFVGLVTINGEAPLRIHVVGPDTSPLVGTEILFSEDRSKITVNWPSWRRAGTAVRPNVFHKKELTQQPERNAGATFSKSTFSPT